MHYHIQPLPKTCDVIINLSKQSADIALGVDKSLEDKMVKVFVLLEQVIKV